MQNESVALCLKSVKFDCKPHVPQPLFDESIPLLWLHPPFVQPLKYAECGAHGTANEEIRFLIEDVLHALLSLFGFVEIPWHAIFIILFDVIGEACGQSIFAS